MSTQEFVRIESPEGVIEYNATPIRCLMLALDNKEKIDYIEAIKALNSHQMLAFCCELYAEAQHLNRLLLACHTKEHMKMLEKIHYLKDKAAEAGMPLWPEID